MFLLTWDKLRHGCEECGVVVVPCEEILVSHGESVAGPILRDWLKSCVHWLHGYRLYTGPTHTDSRTSPGDCTHWAGADRTKKYNIWMKNNFLMSDWSLLCYHSWRGGVPCGRHCQDLLPSPSCPLCAKWSFVPTFSNNYTHRNTGGTDGIITRRFYSPATL